MDYTIDAKGKRLGRLASEIAVILQGKKSPQYDHRVEGDARVIVKNCDKMEVSDTKKLKQRVYYRHTTQIGHLKAQTLGDLWDKRGSGVVLRKVVMGMLPKNKLRIKRIKKLIIER